MNTKCKVKFEIREFTLNAYTLKMILLKNVISITNCELEAYKLSFYFIYFTYAIL